MTGIDTSAEAVGEIAAKFQSSHQRKVNRHAANPRYHRPDDRFRVIPDLLRALVAERDALRLAVAEARNAALDEAADICNEKGAGEQFNYGLTRGTQNYFRARDEIRALKTTTKGDSEDG